jgi:uncharacterized protein (DUF58 family)
MNPAQRVVLLLLGLSLLAGAVTGSQFYYRLGYIWAFFFAANWVIARLALMGLRLRRTPRMLRSQVGQVFEERFEIRNTTTLPRLWLEVRDESPLPGVRGIQVLSMIGARESRTFLARTRLVERGVFPLGSTVLASGDLFGLFPVARTSPAQESLLVYPMLVDVRHFPSPPGWLSGGEALRRRTHQITPNAAGVRDYVHGDPLNRIHWLSTARRNKLIAKEFELDPLAEVWIFVDAEMDVQAHQPRDLSATGFSDIWQVDRKVSLRPSTEEYSVSVAASLARYYLQLGRVVGLVSAGQVMTVLPSDRGGRQLGKILEALALLRAEGDLPIEALVEIQAQNLPRGSTVVLITPNPEEEVALTCEYLIRRGMRPVVVLVDAASFGGPPGAARLAQALAMLRVPVCRVANGDDLGAALSEASSQQIWS